MSFVDMPLHELRAYKGSTPRPQDFNGFWAAALDEVHATPMNVEQKPATFKLRGYDTQHVFFDGVRGGRIHAKMIKPSGESNLPIALNFHGYSARSGDWIDLLPYAAAGFAVFAMDCRGQGGLSTDPGGVVGNTLHGHIIRGLDDGPENLLFRHIFLDTVQLASVARSMTYTDVSRICAYGGSQGGGLAIACAALNPQVSLMASVYPFLCDYRRVWDLNLQSDAYKELKLYFRRFDPTHKREDEIFTTLGYIDASHLASRITAESIFAISLNDGTCPPSTCFAAYNNVVAKKEVHIYPDFGHERLPEFDDVVLMKFQAGV